MPFSRTNIDSIIAALSDQGITNPYLQAGILATTAKETNIQPIRENLNYTSASRLRFVWPSLFPTDASAQPYLNNPQKLGDFVYGGKNGNAPNEGYKYRGAGYNGLTFKSNYQRYGQLAGIDLVSNPDVLNDPAIAAKVLAVFYKERLSKSGCAPSKYTLDHSNDITNLDAGVRLAVAATAGCPSSTSGNIFREGLSKASAFAPMFITTTMEKKSSSRAFAPGTATRKWGLIIIGIVILLIIAIIIIYRKKIITKLS